jgi:hypothetical protein
MKKLTIEEIQEEINEIVYHKRNLRDTAIDFDNNTFVDCMLEVFNCARILEYKVYFKNYKRPSKDLRRLYLMVEKYIQHEKRGLLEFRKQLDELSIWEDEDE